VTVLNVLVLVNRTKCNSVFINIISFWFQRFGLNYLKIDSEQRCEQNFDKVWKKIVFAFICNKVTCLLCGYQPSIVKKFVLQRHYKTKHFNEYSKYVDKEKSSLIEGLKLISRTCESEEGSFHFDFCFDFDEI